jgi:hypothetical protein
MPRGRDQIVSNGLYRIAAVTLLVGSLLVTLGNLLASQGNVRAALASDLYYPATLAVLLGGLLVLPTIIALYLRQRVESGVLGFVGMAAVLGAGMLLSVGFPVILLLIYPQLATITLSTKVLDEGSVAFTIFFAVASAVVSLGGVLFGVATIRARVFSRQLGIGVSSSPWQALSSAS